MCAGSPHHKTPFRRLTRTTAGPNSRTTLASRIRVGLSRVAGRVAGTGQCRHRAWQGQGSAGMQKLKNAVLYAALAYSTYQVLNLFGLRVRAAFASAGSGRPRCRMRGHVLIHTCPCGARRRFNTSSSKTRSCTRSGSLVVSRPGARCCCLLLLPGRSLSPVTAPRACTMELLLLCMQAGV